MLRNTVIATGLAMLWMLTAAAGQQEPPPDPTPPPRGTTSFTPLPDLDRQPLTPENFVVRAAVANMSEIELGQLALQKSADPALKQFAREMIQHHRAAIDELKEVAAAQHVALPGTVDEDHRRLQQELATLEGTAFDRKYLQAMASGHDKVVALFEAASQSGELPEAFRNYASESLTAVKEHRKSAHALHATEQ